MSRAVWIVGLVIGALAVPASCVGGVMALQLVGNGSVEGTLVFDGITARPEPVRCRDGQHLHFTGITVVAEDWSLDIVDAGHTITAYLRTPKLPHELELDAAHCSKHELVLRDDSDEDTDMMSGVVDLQCAFDAVRVRGHLELEHCK